MQHYSVRIPPDVNRILQGRRRVFKPMKSTFRENGEAGNAILEFAIILPMLFALILGTVEYSQLFRVKEFQSLVTRESSSIAYRYCFERGTRNCETRDLLDDLGLTTDTRLEACLEQWNETIDTFLAGIFPGSTLSLSFWELDTGTNAISLRGMTTRRDGSNVPTKSAYRHDLTKLRRDFGPMLAEHEVIVIAESYFNYPFTLIDVFVPNLELYHVSAY